MQKLALKGRKSHILLRTTGQEKVVSTHMVVGLEMARLEGEDLCELPKTYIQQHLTLHRGNIPGEQNLKSWPHLNQVHLPEVDADVDLLIGTNVPKAFQIDCIGLKQNYKLRFRLYQHIGYC